MMNLLDANVILRYLTDEPPDLAKRAATLIDGETPLLITPHVLAEVAYVLLRVYGRERGQVIDVLTDLLQRENIHLQGVLPEVAVEALSLCRPSGRVNVSDALLWAVARSQPSACVWSFDRRFPAREIELREPGL